MFDTLSCTVAKWKGTRLLSEISQVRSLPVQPMRPRWPASQRSRGRRRPPRGPFFQRSGSRSFTPGRGVRFSHGSLSFFGMKPNGRAPRLGRGSCWFDSSRPDRPGRAVRRGSSPVSVAVAQPSRAAETPTSPPLPGSGRPAWVTSLSRSRVRIPSATPTLVGPALRGALGETSEEEETLERGPP